MRALKNPPPASGTAENWIKEINQAFGFSFGWLVNAVGLLNEAKQQLEHGQWMSMFQRGKLKFGPRTAEMLMKIASHPTLRDPKYFWDLPPAWTVLQTSGWISLITRLAVLSLRRNSSISAMNPAADTAAPGCAEVDKDCLLLGRSFGFDGNEHLVGRRGRLSQGHKRTR